MINFKEEVKQIILGFDTGLTEEEISDLIEIPPNSDMGDYAFPVFKLAKTFRKAPNLIAEELAKKEFSNENIKKIANVGPYVNFFVDNSKLVESVLTEAVKDDFGSSHIGVGKNVVFDFSSTNIAKPFHIGHLRSTVIGNAIRNIMKYQGFNTTGVNYIGDYGTQFGMMISAYLKWGDEDKINADPIKELLNLYVKYNKIAKEDETYMDEARDWFDKLEKKDPTAVKLWSWFREISLKEFQRVYDLLGVEFDNFNGESFHSQFIGDALEAIDKKNLLEESDGAMIINLDDENLPPVLIKKSNGSSTYLTRDIATAMYRKKTYDFYKNVYVVASQQKLHFEQLRAVLKKMGFDWWNDCEHVSFGMVSMKDGSMKTREGKVIFLEDVLNRAIDKTKSIIEERNPNLENKEEVAKQVGVGAVIFQDLFNNRIKDYTFDWDQVLNFDGETGPYTQYTFARSCSILDKGEFELKDNSKFDLLVDDTEIDIVKHLSKFEEVLLNATEKYEPSFLTRYTVELAKLFNKFYANCPINTVEDELKYQRLYLTYSVNKCLKLSLSLLGIEAPVRM
ncbi:arginine--tRNA ligase [Finegoldia sp. BIOML-A3]|uniref:arginine--tRNA ligase n=1 Tax=Finegoldia TaxID=150022 RepID=UPI000B9167CD|nr:MULTISPECIES: arginine--tRNA ligase [Finegoldia]MDU2499472.1 arginine--tRNA ligase [Finegoldia magna]MDU4208909.1 arginine--tRNA ligase [Finegoldia magna]MDU7330356.1 arginine--tRNA ligase [Finegoldia magna]MSA98122.1 arginine--tRNA ligase [Finegoldia sp. BIOML-A3]MSB92130.1 arginine--tRNA ligase [Finegoldia sp. BIOML-A4]